jgi:3-hydroxybutyryl-CoA dehydrogenase
VRLAVAAEAGAVGDSIRAVLARGHDLVAWREGAADGVDAGVDAIVTDSEAKRRALREMDGALPPRALILTCAHAESTTSLARDLVHPDRLIGFGLLPPVETRTMVECAAGHDSSTAAVELGEALWSACALETCWVGDAAGLVMPRILAGLANEAAFTVMERTASPEDVDRAMELGTAYPRGPLSWAELIGLPHVVAILDGLRDEHGDRYRVAPLLRRLATARTTGWGPPAQGRPGREDGAG